MSHFTVMVFGENPEEQIAKYDENIVVEEYSVGFVKSEDKLGFLQYYGETDFDSAYKKHGELWNRNNWRLDEEGRWCEYSTYNPDAKWDWYVIGGRWTGFFKVKKGHFGSVGETCVSGTPAKKGYADQLLKGAIDIEYMRNDAGKRAMERWEFVHNEIICGESFTTFDKLRGSFTEIQDARDAYWNQPVLIRWKRKQAENTSPIGFLSNIEDYLISKEDYIENARRDVITPYAYVVNGEWFGRGDMGWWGVSSNESDAYDEQFNNVFQQMPDDTLVTIIDCHI